MKKFLSFMAIFVISSTCFFSCGSTNGTNEEAATINDFTLKGYVITYNGDCTDGIINIPSEINGETVEKIERLDLDSYRDYDKITKIIIPETVIDFDNLGFGPFNGIRECEVTEDNPEYCSIDGVVYSKDKTRLCYVPPFKPGYKIPDYVTEIDDYAFNNWNGFELYIPSTVKKVGLFSRAKITITLDDSFKNDTELINSLVCKDDYTEIKVICGGEEFAPDIEAYNEKKLEELRNETFSGNRTLWQLSFLDYNNKDYEDVEYSRLSINSMDVQIKDGKIVISMKVKSNIEFNRDWYVTVGYYNAAGEKKGEFECHMGNIAGLGADEGTFEGVPNCIDYLKYYRITNIRDAQ